MKNSRMLIEYLYQFINTLDDKDLKKICSGEYKIILDKGSIENNKDRIKTKTSKKKSVTMDIRIVENLHKRVLSCKSRIEAKNVFEEYNLKKYELLFI